MVVPYLPEKLYRKFIPEIFDRLLLLLLLAVCVLVGSCVLVALYRILV